MAPDIRKLLRLRHLFWPYLLVLLIATVIPLGADSTVALNNNYTLNIRWDYLLHAVVYLPLPVLMRFYMQNLRNTPNKIRGVSFIKIPLFSVLIAAAYEFLQMFLPYRTFNLNDLAGNEAGVVLGILIIPFFYERKKNVEHR